MTEPLEDALRTAETALRLDVDGHLARPHRRAIERLLGDGPIGHARRLSLSLRGVEGVLPVWDRTCPNDASPHRILDLARAFFEEPARRSEAAIARGQHWAALDELLPDHPTAAYVGYAAVLALALAMADRDADEDTTVTDAELTPHEWDAAYYASLAVAGASPGEPGRDATAGRDFWRWYLRAVVEVAGLDGAFAVPTIPATSRR